MEKLLDTLTSLPLSLKKEYASSIGKENIRIMCQETRVKLLFVEHLNPLFSFIDYALIEHFIKKFGTDALKEEMQSYCCEMAKFMKETTIKQLIDHLPGQPEIPPKFSLVEAKIDRDASKCTLEQLNTIRKKYCSEVKLSEIVFHLVAVVDSNSFIVRWIVPSVLVSDIIKCTGNIEQSLYQETKITSLTLDAMWLYMCEAEIEAMWLHVNDTKLKDHFHTTHKQVVCELKVAKISYKELSQCLMDQQQNLSEDTSIQLSEALMNHDPFPPCFVDFEVINIIVEQYGSDCLKSVMKSYCSYMSVFTKHSTIQQLINLSVGCNKHSQNFLIAECRIMKAPLDYTLDSIQSLKNSICTEIDSSRFAFALSSIRSQVSGSFSVSWLVPTCLAHDLIESGSQVGSAFYTQNNMESLSIGNQWVYNPKLTSFGAQLKEQYQQSQGSPSPVEWIPSPTNKIFRLAMIQREKVQRGHIADRFVRMTISGRVDDILHVKSPVELEHIFRDTLYGSEICLIEGAPGSGKSTLTVHICQRWGKGELLQQFSVVILVQLQDPAVQRALTIPDLLPVENVAVAQVLATELIATNGRGVLWILDGWDELPTHLQRYSIFRYLISESLEQNARFMLPESEKLRLLNECSVIVTSRPISSGDLHPLVSSRIEVLGFAQEEQRQYFTECLKGDTKALEALLEKVQENPMVQSICYLPLNAAFVVHSFKLKGELLANTLYEIYSTVILSCIQRHFEREGRGSYLPGKLASLRDLLRIEAVKEPFQYLCELAYHGVMENKVTFSSSDLPQGSNTFSLLQAIESFLNSGKSMFYNFLHLSIQEVLSAYYIATWLSDSKQVSQFQQMFNQPRFAAVFQFYGAITKLKSPEIRQVIARIVKQKSNPLLVSLLRCLYEAQNHSLCHYVAERLEYQLNLSWTSLSPLDVLSISLFLSSVTDKEISVDLGKCYIGDIGAKCLTKYLGSDHVSIVTIDLRDNDIHEEGASYITKMLYFTENLYLSHNPLGDTGASLISEAVRETATLKTLILSCCGITLRGIEDLSKAMAQNSSLKKLDISRNNLGDEGISHVAGALKQNKRLKELWIGECGMTDKGAASLASALSVNNSLKMLHMGERVLTKGALSTIIQSVALNPEFVELEISSGYYCHTDHLLPEVNKARKKSGLQYIEIAGECCIHCVVISYRGNSLSNFLTITVN